VMKEVEKSGGNGSGTHPKAVPTPDLD